MEILIIVWIVWTILNVQIAHGKGYGAFIPIVVGLILSPPIVMLILLCARRKPSLAERERLKQAVMVVPANVPQEKGNGLVRGSIVLAAILAVLLIAYVGANLPI